MAAAPLLNTIATAFINGDQSAESITGRLELILGRRRRLLNPVVSRYLQQTSGKARPRRRAVVRFLLEDLVFQRVWNKHLRKLPFEYWIADPPPMQPLPAAAGWPVPSIQTAGDLAAWLAITPNELDWFADLKNLNGKSHHRRLEHYHYRVFVKRSGGIRLVEAPKARLKKFSAPS